MRADVAHQGRLDVDRDAARPALFVERALGAHFGPAQDLARVARAVDEGAREQGVLLRAAHDHPGDDVEHADRPRPGVGRRVQRTGSSGRPAAANASAAPFRPSATTARSTARPTVDRSDRGARRARRASARAPRAEHAAAGAAEHVARERRQRSAQPVLDRHRESVLGASHDVLGQVAPRQRAQHPLATLRSEARSERQTGCEAHQRCAEERHAPLDGCAHGGPVLLEQQVIREVIEMVEAEGSLLSRRRRPPHLMSDRSLDGRSHVCDRDPHRQRFLPAPRRRRLEGGQVRGHEVVAAARLEKLSRHHDPLRRSGTAVEVALGQDPGEPARGGPRQGGATPQERGQAIAPVTAEHLVAAGAGEQHGHIGRGGARDQKGGHRRRVGARLVEKPHDPLQLLPHLERHGELAMPGSEVRGHAARVRAFVVVPTRFETDRKRTRFVPHVLRQERGHQARIESAREQHAHRPVREQHRSGGGAEPLADLGCDRVGVAAGSEVKNSGQAQ
jgi:hypothetical protein